LSGRVAFAAADGIIRTAWRGCGGSGGRL